MKKSSNSNSLQSVLIINLYKISNCVFELILNCLRTNFSVFTFSNKLNKFPEILYNSSDIINSFNDNT